MTTKEFTAGELPETIPIVIGNPGEPTSFGDKGKPERIVVTAFCFSGGGGSGARIDPAPPQPKVRYLLIGALCMAAVNYLLWLIFR